MLCEQINNLIFLELAFILTDMAALFLNAHFSPCVTCHQVGTATSTTTLWDDFCVMQSCMKSAQAQVKFAGSSLDEPSTPCSNKVK